MPYVNNNEPLYANIMSPVGNIKQRYKIIITILWIKLKQINFEILNR